MKNPSNYEIRLREATEEALSEFMAITDYKEFSLFINTDAYNNLSKKQWAKYKKDYPNVDVCVSSNGTSAFDYDYVVNEQGELDKI